MTEARSHRPACHVSRGDKVAICILAGGLSRRMGRNKAVIRLGGLTLLQRVRATAAELELPIRVIRRDLVPRCGPLGGIYTGLITSRAEAELFLACDMPFIDAQFLRKLIDRFGKAGRPVFMRVDEVAGFPLLVPAAAAATVLHRIEAKELSIQALAKALRAALINVKSARASQLRNLNSPGDVKLARASLAAG